jgi:glutamate synthase (NADPH/NADH) large chain
VEVADTLDAKILKDAQPFFERGEKMQLDYAVVNTQRAIGARSSSKTIACFGEAAPAPGRLLLRLTGSAGQSLGAFLTRGIAIDLTGDANDYVGKGLSGGRIVLRPHPKFADRASENAIIGNTVLYGATSGELFAAGLAGERFGVRNSGADAVIEGCGANGCEYMTGGRVVILGELGENFGAGMTGGIAYVWDRDDRFALMANADTIVWRRLASAHWEAQLRALIEAHVAFTGSRRGQQILDDWQNEVRRFWQVTPKEMLSRLSHPLDDLDKAVVAA